MSSTKYYYLNKHNKVIGPLSLDELAKKFVEYEIQATTNICKEGGTWVQAKHYDELTKSVSAERAVRSFNINKQKNTTATPDEKPSKCELDKEKLAKSCIPSVVNGIGIAIYIITFVSLMYLLFTSKSFDIELKDCIVWITQLITGLLFQSLAYVLRYIRYKAAK